jgi:Protein of unknown function (DUF3800)
MLVFVDESGDPGLKGKAGSSKFFVMVAVLFQDAEAAEACDKKIDQLRKNRGGTREYKFASCKDEDRTRFFEGVIEHDFFYLAFVLNKRELWSPSFNDKEKFWSYTASLLVNNAKGHLDNATIVVDRCGNRDFQQKLRVSLQKKINSAEGRKHIKKIKMEDSRSNNLLQLADMICGAVARSFSTEKNDHRLYRKIISHREMGIQIWPR